MLSIDDAAAIRAATMELCTLHPPFAATFTSARNLLLRGGWEHSEAGTLIFGGASVICGIDHCTCRNGSGPLVCQHKLAARILHLAHERAAGLERCTDCRERLSEANRARIGRRTLTICRTCCQRRARAGLLKRRAADLLFVASRMAVTA